MSSRLQEQPLRRIAPSVHTQYGNDQGAVRDIQLQDHSTFSTSAFKRSRRTGPLDPSSKTKAAAVRKKGACFRCADLKIGVCQRLFWAPYICTIQLITYPTVWWETAMHKLQNGIAVFEAQEKAKLDEMYCAYRVDVQYIHIRCIKFYPTTFQLTTC